MGSMGATLYAALVMHSYVMSLVCCAAQVSVWLSAVCVLDCAALTTV